MLSADYELMIYTASISEYADPVVDYIDPDNVVSVRLFRENCTLFKNVFVKDLANLNRDIRNIIIVDNSPNSFMFQPMNAFQIRNFFDDMNDQELYFLIPFFKLLKDVSQYF
jgi:RNA polymerase II subunit A small phosphatase-like protein